MTPTTFFRWVAWILVLAIAVFTLAPINFRPLTGAPVSLERFSAFALIGTTFCLGYPKHRLTIVVLVIGIVGLLEVAQNYVPDRHGRLPDGLVKVSGALLGVIFATLLEHFSVKWLRFIVKNAARQRRDDSTQMETAPTRWRRVP